MLNGVFNACSVSKDQDLSNCVTIPFGVALIPHITHVRNMRKKKKETITNMKYVASLP